MAQCTSCGNALRDGAKFCAKCGTKQDGALAAVASATVGEIPKSSPAVATDLEPERCPACGKTAVPGVATCWACGASLTKGAVGVSGSPPSPTAAPIHLPPVPAVDAGDQRFSGRYVVLIGAAVVVLGGFIWWWISSATMRRFNDALQTGKLTGTDGHSAYELYSQAVTESGTSSRTVQEMKQKAKPVLEQRVADLYQRWYQESDLGDGVRWTDLQKLSAWLADIDSSRSDNQAQAKFAQGQADLLANRFTDAEQLFRVALNFKANWPLALNGIGRACRNERNYQCAEEYYRRAIQADPQWIFPHQNLAGLFMEQNKLSDAEGEYQAAVRLNPNRAGSRFLLGQLYDRKRQPTEACNEYRAALSLAASQTRPSFDREYVNRRIQKLCK